MSLLPLLVALLVVFAGQVAAFTAQLDFLPGTLASVASGLATYVPLRVWASKRRESR
jgi:hypothetical protein